ncbi:MAG: T9SS type A sorting domain-containing protein [Melioribacteraceae bacterium]|nr:T9SS type A sorting domain-containing protein [Melioribacteraceae bacterium]MCF8353268.1 T9SS type A sorting domain-containing protein [Melioribacteraceae bacterium]MCF8394846.1 T9SS type A sorting domain-containing protein [Melioribacteraceae bacterium]MCF8418795.1 T9SS type A sorting domain-containing protein [Melioribacteraceae bacterium]
MKSIHTKIFLTIILSLFYVTIFSQWTDDPSQNTPVAQIGGDQTIPKMQLASDGSSYYSWYDDRDGNYSMYMQRLDSSGNPAWEENGILISSHPQNSWLTDYDLTVDKSGNAILVFNDVRDGGDWDMFVYKISPSGDFLWGNDGVSISPPDNNYFEAAPKVCVTDSGNVVVAWLTEENGQSTRLQKLSPNGDLLWGDGVLFTSDSSLITDGLIVPSDGDNIIMLYKNSTGSFPALTSDLYFQKFNSIGEPMWIGGIDIYSLGGIPGFKIPGILSDGKGGAWAFWEHQPALDQFNVGIGHIDSSGNLLIPHNGIYVSNDNSKLHLYPSITRTQRSDNLYVFWVTENYDQNQWGLSLQKISENGNLLFGRSAKQIRSLGSKPLGFASLAGIDSMVFISFFESSSPTANDAAVLTTAIDTSGNILWPEVMVSLAENGNKDDLIIRANSTQAILAWRDERNDFGDVFAQNINIDGTMGIVTAINDNDAEILTNYRLLLSNYPNPFNPSTKIYFELPDVGNAELKIYSIDGQLVRNLFNSSLTKGSHILEWDGKSNNGSLVASGNYFCELRFKGLKKIQKMVLLR